MCRPGSGDIVASRPNGGSQMRSTEMIIKLSVLWQDRRRLGTWLHLSSAFDRVTHQARLQRRPARQPGRENRSQ